MFWRKKANYNDMQFTTRAEAFTYMLKYQLEERRVDPMEAADKANQFADMFAKNMGVPDKLLNGVDKYMDMADKVVCYCESHPKVVEYVTGAATFLVGAIVGNKVAKDSEPTQQQEQIDFDSIE